LSELTDLEAWARGTPPARPGPAARPRRRIIPVASGKGGVGKTTFALNFALELSRHGRTVLVDLDTGTSSLRAALDAPVERDLYHFFRHELPLSECVTRLPERLDPHGAARQFGFVAAPRHYVEDVSQFDEARRARLRAALATLEADFVVLDLRAGLGENVLGFLPRANSGILVFTPHLPAATLAAADLVKALIFRRLRARLERSGLAPGEARRAGELLERAGDAYDGGPSNLDAFLDALRREFPGHEFVKAATADVDSFTVHYVLNMFDGVRDSYAQAVKPFVEALERHVSAHLTLLNLGWVVRHEDFDRAARARVPALLWNEAAPAEGVASARDAAQDTVERLATQYLGARTGPRREPRAAAAFAQALGVTPPPTASRPLDAQLAALVRMYDGLKGASWRDNFRYVTHRALHVLRSRAVSEFGDVHA
jgi:flagellar biosynthesis protein FlhG